MIPKKTSEKILKIIREKGQASAHELSHTLDISPRAIFKQLARLLTDGRLEKIGLPPKVYYLIKQNVIQTENFELSKKLKKRISASTLLKLLQNFSDRTGHFEIATVYAEADGSTQEFVYTVPIYFANEERGTLQNGWARLMILEGEKRTLAEYPETERLGVWSKNYGSIARNQSEFF